MSDDRLARALLRLYPRAWRARYGDEFLALVGDTGLSWRTVADVSTAALAERVRAIAGAKLWEGDPIVAGQPLPPRTVGEALTVAATFAGLVGLSVLVLGLLGVPYPRSGSPWFQRVFWWWLIVNNARLDPVRGEPGGPWRGAFRLVWRRGGPRGRRVAHRQSPGMARRSGAI